jgi:hypothetical protein
VTLSSAIKGIRPPRICQTPDLVAGYRLLDERQAVRLQAPDEAGGFANGQALIEVHAQRHPIADCLADGGDTRDTVVAGPGHLDLRRRESAPEPLEGLGRRRGLHRPDPGIERFRS